MLIIILLASATVLFTYNLHNWRITTLEELGFYKSFMNNWLNVRFNSFYVPTFVLAYILPTRDLVTLRYLSAFLSVLGAGFYYKSIEKASGDKQVAFLASLLIVFNTVIIWNARHFAFFWSIFTLSSLTLLIHFYRHEDSFLSNAVISGISVLNFGQAVFFVFSYLPAMIWEYRKSIDWRKVVVGFLLFAVIVAPSINLFLSTQPNYVKSQYFKYSPDAIDGQVKVTGLAKIAGDLTQFNPLTPKRSISGSILLVFDPVHAFRSLEGYLVLNKNPEMTANPGALDITLLTDLLGALIILYPAIFFAWSDWDEKEFFTLTSMLTILVLIFFPVQTDATYLYAFFMFIGPCAAYGLLKDQDFKLKLVSLLVVMTLSLQIVDDVQMIDVNTAQQFKKVENRTLAGQKVILTRNVEQMINLSHPYLLDTMNYTTVPDCYYLRKQEGYLLASEGGCNIPGRMVDGVQWINVYHLGAPE